MAGDLSMPEVFTTKKAMYDYVVANLEEHLGALKDIHKKFDASFNLTTALANAASLIYYAMNSYDVENKGADAAAATEAGAAPQALLHKAIVNWVGFYLIADAQYMVLGPFQGKVACTRIKIGKGVCGTAVLLGKTQCIPNVHEFPGHIACDSGSESEIVVPIRDDAGRIVGVLDIDSTVLNRFDSVDVMRLTDIAVMLSKHCPFPNVADQRGKNLEPLDGRVAAEPTSIPVAQITTPATTASGDAKLPTTAIVRPPVVPSTSTDPTAPVTKTKHLAGDWVVQCTRLDRIISAPEIGRWEEEHKVGCIPEIVFPLNAIEVKFTNQKTNIRTTLTVDAESYFISASEFYKTRKDGSVKSNALLGAVDETYDGLLEDQQFLQIPVADSWKQSQFGKFDPNIDWASRSNYICSVKREALGSGDGSADVATTGRGFVPSDAAAVNYDMLKRRDLDILMFESFDLFEDDLHDCGVSKASVKMRVMPLCIFILVRHVVRVDAAAAMVRDVRLYVELDAISGVAGIAGKTPAHPKVVAEVTYKHLVFPSSPLGVAPGTPQQQTRQVENSDKAHLRISLDDLVEQMQPSGPARNYVLEL